MDEWLLTGDEITEAEQEGFDKHTIPNPLGSIYEAIAKAQAKKLAEWVEEQMAKEVGFDSWQELVESDIATVPDYWRGLRKELGLE